MSKIADRGLDALLAEWLEIDRGRARLLRLLLAADGRVVRREALAAESVRVGRNGLSLTSVPVMISGIRAALPDVGFVDCIETVGEGWAIPADVSDCILLAFAEWLGEPIEPEALAPEARTDISAAVTRCDPAHAWKQMKCGVSLARLAENWGDDVGLLDLAVWRWRAGCTTASEARA